MGLLTSNGTLRSQDKGVECGVFPVQRKNWYNMETITEGQGRLRA